MARLSVKPEDWLTAAVEKAFVDASDNRLDPGWHHPSSVVHPCEANKQFNFIGAKKERTPYILAYTSTLGTFIHETIQGLVSPENHRLVNGTEISAEDLPLRMRGRLDYDVTDPDGERVIVDIKTIENLPSIPRKKDILQVLWYMHMEGVQRGAIFYVRRSSGSSKRFTFRWKDWEQAWVESMESIRQITEDTMNGIMSPRTPESRQYCVKDCPFFNQCEAVVGGDKTEWNTLVNRTIGILNGK